MSEQVCGAGDGGGAKVGDPVLLCPESLLARAGTSLSGSLCPAHQAEQCGSSSAPTLRRQFVEQVCGACDGGGAQVGDPVLHVRLVQRDPDGPGARGAVRHLHHRLHVRLRLLPARARRWLEHPAVQRPLPRHQPPGPPLTASFL